MLLILSLLGIGYCFKGWDGFLSMGFICLLLICSQPLFAWLARNKHGG